MVGGQPIRLREGDLILFPQGDPHVLSSEPGLRASPDLSLFVRPSTPLPIVYEVGGGGPDRARVVCCFLGCDERPFNPLLTALPKVIHLARAGRDNVLARLSELMFVEAIRRYIESLPPAQTGWLAGLRDAVVGQALAALHADPVQPWTVERLARHVGVSRSLLADRFAGMVGETPMQYLALWRMQLASRRLLEGGAVAAVAAAVGYESEAAFSRAFKKLVGEAPATWRRAAASRDAIG